MHKKLILLILLITFTVAAFSPVITAGFINFDDGLYVTENPFVQLGLTAESLRWAFTSLHANNWHPVTWISHLLDFQLFGMNPAGHHLTNLLLHLLNTLLLVWLLNRLTGAYWRSFTVSALFALHPLHVESVAWVAERKDLLCAFFWLLTMLSYERFARNPEIRIYLLSFFFFICGLLSKPMIVTLPIVLLLVDLWPLGRWCNMNSYRAREVMYPQPPVSRLILEKVPFIVASLIASFVTVAAQQSSLNFLSPLVRLLNVLNSYSGYIKKMIWPGGLAIFYPFDTTVSAWRLVASCTLLLIISLLCVTKIRKYPYLLFGWLWYLITLLPVIGLIQVGEQAMADRYTYLPGIGLFIMLVWGAADIAAEYSLPNRVFVFSVGLLLLVLSGMTFRQAGFWLDSVTLFSHALAVTDRNHLAHNNLGVALMRKRDYQAALWHFKESAKIHPSDSDVWTNMGITYCATGRYGEAKEVLRQALVIKPDNLVAQEYFELADAFQPR